MNTITLRLQSVLFSHLFYCQNSIFSLLFPSLFFSPFFIPYYSVPSLSVFPSVQLCLLLRSARLLPSLCCWLWAVHLPLMLQRPHVCGGHSGLLAMISESPRVRNCCHTKSQSVTVTARPPGGQVGSCTFHEFPLTSTCREIPESFSYFYTLHLVLIV